MNVFTLLLAGIAVNAVCSAGTGFLSYVARDPQARNITFWNLGTFTTADWRGVALVGRLLRRLLRLVAALRQVAQRPDARRGRGRLPRAWTRSGSSWSLLVVNTLMVAVATAMVGVIAFVGLVVPHALRMLRSADYTFLLPASALLGAGLMEVIDIVARVVIAPAELPIGIITAVVGAPVFLWILLRQRAGAGRASMVEVREVELGGPATR